MQLKPYLIVPAPTEKEGKPRGNVKFSSSQAFQRIEENFAKTSHLKNGTKILLFHQSEASQKASRIAHEILKLQARKS